MNQFLAKYEFWTSFSVIFLELIWKNTKHKVTLVNLLDKNAVDAKISHCYKLVSQVMQNKKQKIKNTRIRNKRFLLRTTTNDRQKISLAFEKALDKKLI